MANAREIQGRMKSIKDTMKITNAMYMVSSSKLQKARRDLKNTVGREKVALGQYYLLSGIWLLAFPFS